MLGAGHRQLIVELVEKYRLPAFYLYRDYVEAGGLMAYSLNDVELWTHAAGCIAQIVNGASPGDTPYLSGNEVRVAYFDPFAVAAGDLLASLPALWTAIMRLIALRHLLKSPRINFDLEPSMFELEQRR